MASSTTRPIARTIASRVSRFIEKPINNIRKAPPINDKGKAIAGIKAARTEPKVNKITESTINTASANVVNTSLIDC